MPTSLQKGRACWVYPNSFGVAQTVNAVGSRAFERRLRPAAFRPFRPQLCAGRVSDFEEHPPRRALAMTGAKPIAQPSSFGLRNCLDFRVFGEGQCVFNVDAEITYSAFNFGVTQQNLHGAQVSRLLVDQSRLSST